MYNGNYQIGLPKGWTEPHRHLYNRLRGVDMERLLKDYERYINHENDPKLKNYPQEIIDKTIEVMEYIFEKIYGLKKVDYFVKMK